MPQDMFNNPQAFEPFYTDEIRVCASGRIASDAKDELAVRGMVSLVDADASDVGKAKAGKRYSVAIQSGEFDKLLNKPARGMTILRDFVNGRWPELNVQKLVMTIDGDYALDCSAREGWKKP